MPFVLLLQRLVYRVLFATLQSNGVNAILLSQALSEHSISFACEERQSHVAKVAIDETLSKDSALEMHAQRNAFALPF
jgi:hypothetical protein